MLDFYDAHIVPGAPAERRLCTHVWGGRSARDMDVVVAELEAARGGADGPSAHALVVTDAGLAAFKACQPRYSIGPLGDGALPPLTVGATHLSAL